MSTHIKIKKFDVENVFSNHQNVTKFPHIHQYLVIVCAMCAGDGEKDLHSHAL